MVTWQLNSSGRMRRRAMRYILTAVLALALGTLAGTTSGKAANIEGSWSGSGKVKLNSGQVEPVRCRVRYEKSTGRTFILQATCAHTNGTFQQSGRVVQISNSRYTGSLYSDQYDVSGDVAVSVNGSRQTVTVSSPKGSGSITLNKQ